MRFWNLELATVRLVTLAALVSLAACTKDKATSPAPDETPETSQEDDGESRDNARRPGEGNDGGPSRGGQGGGDGNTGGNTAGDQTCSEKPTYKPHENPAGITESDIIQWANNHRLANSSQSQWLRYAHVPLDMLSDPAMANRARVALSKAINHVTSSATSIQQIQDASDGYGIVFAFNIQELWGDQADAKWDRVINARQKQGVISVGRMFSRPIDGTNPTSIAQLIYNMLHGAIYTALVDTPARGAQMLQREGITPGNIEAWAAQNEAIVFGYRVMHMSRAGDGRKAWQSTDEFRGQEGKQIPYLRGNPVPQFRNPGRSHMVRLNGGAAIASEFIIEAKNGCQIYAVWGNANQERGRAEQSFVIDPQNDVNRYLVTGRSCITCHKMGLQAAPSDMAKAIDEGRISPEFMEQARQIWTPNNVLSQLYKEGIDRFQQQCMKPVVCSSSDGDQQYNSDLIHGVGEEPIHTMIKYIESRRRG